MQCVYINKLFVQVTRLHIIVFIYTYNVRTTAASYIHLIDPLQLAISKTIV